VLPSNGSANVVICQSNKDQNFIPDFIYKFVNKVFEKNLCCLLGENFQKLHTNRA